MTSTFGFAQKPESAPTGGHVLPEDSPEEQEYSARERALRDLFVAEYLSDYNQVLAAMRCGFSRQMAEEYATKFMAEPYVQRQINRIGIGKNDDSPAVQDYNKRRVMEGLTAAAFYFGPGSSHSARVSALKSLAELLKMTETPKEADKNAVGGVMAVPAIADLGEWERAAAASQDALVKHAGTGE